MVAATAPPLVEVPEVLEVAGVHLHAHEAQVTAGGDKIREGGASCAATPVRPRDGSTSRSTSTVVPRRAQAASRRRAASALIQGQGDAVAAGDELGEPVDFLAVTTGR